MTDIKLTDDQIDIVSGRFEEVGVLYRALRRAGAEMIQWPISDNHADYFFAAVSIPDNKRVLYRCLRAVAKHLGCQVYTDTYRSTTERQYFRAKGLRAHDQILSDLAIKLAGHARLRWNNPKSNAGIDGPVLAITLTDLGAIKEYSL